MIIGLTVAALMLVADRPAGWPDSQTVRAESLPECSERWPDNLSLRAACMRNAQDGAESYRSIRAQTGHVPDMKRALDGCIARYTRGVRRNWALIGACARNNLDGLRELGL